MLLSPTPSSHWNPVTRFFFRAGFIYVILYTFPFPFQYIPFSSWLFGWYFSGMSALTQWVGSSILGIDYAFSTTPTGSGDMTSNYVQFFFMTTVALAGALIWSLLDQKRQAYPTLYAWLFVLVRYYLGAIMLGYGFAKIFKTQFPFPTLDVLDQTYGESSPMRLLWTFMGYSTPYNLFAGLGEAVGGFLLFFRKTTTLGALLLVAVMTNVVILNFSYDVPVKLFSTHLLLMAIWLASIDFRRLINVLLLNKPAQARDLGKLPLNQNLLVPGLIAKSIFVGALMVMQILGGFQTMRAWGDDADKNELAGIFDVELFVHLGDTLLAEPGYTERWQRLVIDGYKNRVRSSIRFLNQRRLGMGTMVDSDAKTLSLTSQELTRDRALPDSLHGMYQFNYSLSPEGRLELSGTFEADSMHIVLNRRLRSDFLLVNRGYNWINEFPYNR